MAVEKVSSMGNAGLFLKTTRKMAAVSGARSKYPVNSFTAWWRAAAPLALLALLPLTSRAVCTDQIWKSGWSWTYDGTIGPYRVRFELTRTNGNVTGYYFYASQRKDIRLTGAIVDEKRIDLQELGNDGKTQAIIDGQFPDKDPQGKLRGI